MNITAPLQPTAIHAVPAELCDCGFRLLMIRQFNVGAVPPAFAIIDQRVMRMPQRLGRHGVSFAATFLPEVMAWLIDHLGRPSLHDETGRSYRNPRWPVVCWHDQERYWPSGAVTVEWFAEVAFQDHASWMAFRTHWHDDLMGRNGDVHASGGEAELCDERAAGKEFAGEALQRA